MPGAGKHSDGRHSHLRREGRKHPGNAGTAKESQGASSPSAGESSRMDAIPGEAFTRAPEGVHTPTLGSTCGLAQSREPFKWPCLGEHVICVDLDRGTFYSRDSGNTAVSIIR